MFAAQDILVFSAIAGVLASAVLWATWQWARPQRRFLIDVDAPIVRLSWADAGSGDFACLVTALVLGLITDRSEPALRVVGAAAIAGLVAIGLDLFVL